MKRGRYSWELCLKLGYAQLGYPSAWGRRKQQVGSRLGAQLSLCCFWAQRPRDSNTSTFELALQAVWKVCLSREEDRIFYHLITLIFNLTCTLNI